MDFRQMQYLVTLADEEQFTRAASVCGVSQSGLSAAIRALEDELGTSLFDRTTRRVEPTPAGLALLPHARTMLAQAAAARDAVVRARGVAGLEELRDAAGELGVRLLACDAGLRAEAIDPGGLLGGVEVAGVPTFLDAVRGGQIVSL